MAEAHWGIIGHDWAVDQMRSGLLTGRIGHATLITGPSRVGRSTLALKWAQALNCTEDGLNARPCGVCRSCKLIQSGRHPDLIEVNPVISGRGIPSIKIDQIRALQRSLNLAAVEARRKIGLIHQFEAANVSAANAFLKTLEEPPPNVMLILTASDADALLDTITSRCRTFSLRPVSTDLIRFTLENRHQVLPDDATRIAHMANGRIGWAISAVDEPSLIEGHQSRVARLTELLKLRRVGRFQAVDALSRKPEELPSLLQAWMSWWRDAMWLGIRPEDNRAVVNLDQAREIESWLTQWPETTASAGLKATEEALFQLNRNGNVRLVLEGLMLRYPIPR